MFSYTHTHKQMPISAGLMNLLVTTSSQMCGGSSNRSGRRLSQLLTSLVADCNNSPPVTSSSKIITHLSATTSSHRCSLTGVSGDIITQVWGHLSMTTLSHRCEVNCQLVPRLTVTGHHDHLQPAFKPFPLLSLIVSCLCLVWHLLWVCT